MSEHLDADECDRMIERFRVRLDRLQAEATQTREQFEVLFHRWLDHVESHSDNGGVIR